MQICQNCLTGVDFGLMLLDMGSSRINIVTKRHEIAVPDSLVDPSQINIGAKRRETTTSSHTAQEVKRRETAVPEKGQLSQIH